MSSNANCCYLGWPHRLGNVLNLLACYQGHQGSRLPFGRDPSCLILPLFVFLPNHCVLVSFGCCANISVETGAVRFAHFLLQGIVFHWTISLPIGAKCNLMTNKLSCGWYIPSIPLVSEEEEDGEDDDSARGMGWS